MQCVENCDSRPVVFEQPVWQTLQMFIGEMLCAYPSPAPALSCSHASFFSVPGFLPVLYALFASYRKSSVQLPNNDSDEPVFIHSDLAGAKQRDLHGWRILLLWIPAACDLTGTTVSCRNIPSLGLALTDARHCSS
jgi:hypothetical protein